MPHTVPIVLPEHSPTVEQIRGSVQARLRELAPLIVELQQLEGILSVIDEPRSTLGGLPHVTALLGAPAVPGAAAPAEAGAAPVPQLRRGRRGTKRGRDGRAPQGANKQLIMRTILDRPGISAAEVAELTGLKRTVVTATVNRLKRVGELEPHGDGVRVPLLQRSDAA